MESRALESQMYGNPEDVYAAKQAREARKAAEKAAQPVPRRPILTLPSRKMDSEWSEKRKAAEALFDFPPRLGRS
jgi:hypothetical protein